MIIIDCTCRSQDKKGISKLHCFESVISPLESAEVIQIFLTFFQSEPELNEQNTCKYDSECAKKYASDGHGMTTLLKSFLAFSHVLTRNLKIW